MKVEYTLIGYDPWGKIEFYYAPFTIKIQDRKMIINNSSWATQSQPSKLEVEQAILKKIEELRSVLRGEIKDSRLRSRIRNAFEAYKQSFIDDSPELINVPYTGKFSYKHINTFRKDP